MCVALLSGWLRTFLIIAEYDMENNKNNRTCCFIGHRKIDRTPELEKEIYVVIEDLIKNEKVVTFLFGSKSRFDDLCYETITNLKEKYPHIQRVYVRAEYPHISESFTNRLLDMYEATYYPEHIFGAGKSAYVERNFEMINKSDFCIFYYDENYLPPRRKQSSGELSDYQPKSGTKTAYDYAVKKKKRIVNIC